MIDIIGLVLCVAAVIWAMLGLVLICIRGFAGKL